MKYTTKNEFDHFIFSDVHINDVMYARGVFKLVLDDVIILPENSANRDINKMRTNAMILTIEDASISVFVEEGYKIYDADGNLKEQEADRMVDEQDWNQVFEHFIDAYAYLIDKNGDVYTFVIDGTNERTYAINITGSGDTEEWDRFMQLSSI